MKIAVITATIGEPRRKAIFTPQQIGDGVEYHCFADREVRLKPPWQFHRVERNGELGVMQAKRFKMFGHEYVDADAIVWVDAHLRLMCNPVKLFRQFDEPLGLLKHQRNCVYHETRACIRSHKAPKSHLEAASIHIRHKLKHPPNWGLWWGGFIMRRVTEKTNRMMQSWWNMTLETTPRDQITLPVCIRRHRMHVHTFRRSRREELFRLMGR